MKFKNAKKPEMGVFNFKKYLKANWFFNLAPINKDIVSPLLVNIEKLEHSDEYNKYLDKGEFESESARLFDKAYQAWNKGIIIPIKKDLVDQFELKITLADNYTLSQRYYGKQWTLYVLIRRLLSFKNWYKELKAYYKTKSQTKINFFEKLFDWSSYQDYDSQLCKNQPLVSVIIPTLNRYHYLKDVLNDLEKQNYSNFEVIIVDQSEPFNEKFYTGFNLNLNVVKQDEKALWKARNHAIQIAMGDFLLFFDDDSRVNPDWIKHHLKTLDFFNADISAGISYNSPEERISENDKIFRWADQFDSGNSMVRKYVFEKIGLFDRQFDGMRMGDGEFGLRAYLNGFKSISNPLAKRLHLKVATGGLRQMGSWDAFRSTKFFAPKPIPSVTYLFRKYYPKTFASEALFIGLIFSVIPYQQKKHKRLLFLSFIGAALLSPILVIQFWRSWSKATQMLKEGARIESI
jgi:glycosyltransferase involved in cell wall biosynthesis